MTLTGQELFDVVRNGRRCRLLLSELDGFEVLGLANGQLRAGNHRVAAALYRWQWRMQYGGRKPPHAA